MVTELLTWREKNIRQLREVIDLKKTIAGLQAAAESQADRFLLDVIEQLDKTDAAEAEALKGCDSDEEISQTKANFQSVKAPLLAILEKYEVVALDFPLNELPEFSTPALFEKNTGLAPGAVLSVLKTAYVQGGKILRRAEVAVAADY